MQSPIVFLLTLYISFAKGRLLHMIAKQYVFLMRLTLGYPNTLFPLFFLSFPLFLLLLLFQILTLYCSLRIFFPIPVPLL